MIKTVTIVNYLGKQLDLELTRPEKSGLVVQSITGIGPGKATINITNMASNDGGVFNSARSDTRNIVLNLEMYDTNVNDSAWTIEKARLLTYNFFPKKRPLTLIFKTDNRHVYINGYVESNETNIFSEKEMVQISIICPDPNFYDANGSTIVRLAKVIDWFKFPFSNESTSEDLIVLGKIESDMPIALLRYDAEVETGINIKAKFTGTVTELKFFNYDTGEKIEIDDTKLAQVITDGFSDGDELNICTVRGKKSAKVIRSGVTYNIINSLGFNPSWFQLLKGDNLFTYTTNDQDSNISIEFAYENAYEGV